GLAELAAKASASFGSTAATLAMPPSSRSAFFSEVDSASSDLLQPKAVARAMSVKIRAVRIVFLLPFGPFLAEPAALSRGRDLGGVLKRRRLFGSRLFRVSGDL